MSQWFHIEIERALAVDRGINVILLDRGYDPGGEMLVRMSDEAVEKLKQQISEITLTSR